MVDVAWGNRAIGQLTVDEGLYGLFVAVADWIVPTYVTMSAGAYFFFTEIMEQELAMANVVVGNVLHH